jgi:hypothetical protein
MGRHLYVVLGTSIPVVDPDHRSKKPRSARGNGNGGAWWVGGPRGIPHKSADHNDDIAKVFVPTLPS